jgi:hypothetical protein
MNSNNHLHVNLARLLGSRARVYVAHRFFRARARFYSNTGPSPQPRACVSPGVLRYADAGVTGDQISRSEETSYPQREAEQSKDSALVACSVKQQRDTLGVTAGETAQASSKLGRSHIGNRGEWNRARQRVAQRDARAPNRGGNADGNAASRGTGIGVTGAERRATIFCGEAA